MWRFLPWKFLVRRAARAYGMTDPGEFLARLRRFAQPSEVHEPLELLRAGIVFHARGLVNTKAIQHNMDWVWPYWVTRQFKAGDPSFIPRAFSFSHINLTHRNWTAMGLPDLAVYPIIDPRGLVTPLHDGWSLDFWVLSDAGEFLLPSELDNVSQTLVLEGQHAIVTRCQKAEMRLSQTTSVVRRPDGAELVAELQADSPGGGWLIVAIRPYNPEGVQFIDTLTCDPKRARWMVNGRTEVRLSRPADGLRTSHYEDGDVSERILDPYDRLEQTCPVGMATAASVYRLDGEQTFDLTVTVPLELPAEASLTSPKSWREAEQEAAVLKVPDERMRFLHEAAVHTLFQLSAGEIYPGVYTYRRFWFRDACLMLNALLALGLVSRARRIIDDFPRRQQRDGYFCSQEGEWDSNGQVLWIMDRFRRIANEALPTDWLPAIRSALTWLAGKRVSLREESRVAGLLPAGFSAEHLGTNDFYYWDDFWAVGGLRAIGAALESQSETRDAQRALALGDEFLASIERSLALRSVPRSTAGIPAAPGRRMDSGAVGSLVADYPLRIYPPGDERIAATCDFLMTRSFHRGGFYQEMIHSGINPYLTLDIAQTLLRAGDARFAKLIRAVADLASPTGQWPEAIHPNTLGGCMGDGQHGWAAAEWVMMMRNCFVREEGDALVIGSGLLPEWLAEDGELSYGPTPTPWGPVRVRVFPLADALRVNVEAEWFSTPPPLVLALPMTEALTVTPTDAESEFVLPRTGTPSRLESGKLTPSSPP